MNADHTPSAAIPSESYRLALYNDVNEQIRSYRSHQWTLATLTLTLLFAVGQFVEQHKDIAKTVSAKVIITCLLLALAVCGGVHLARTRESLAKNKRVRKALENSFGFTEWAEVNKLFPLLGKKRVTWMGDAFEPFLWLVAILLVGAASAYIVWHR